MLDVSRKELKYIVGVKEMYYLRERLDKIMSQDKNNGDIGYRVRSLYFDTFWDNDYYDKLDGVDNRQKVRMRIYNDSDSVIKLELKAKEGDFQRKRSLTLNRNEADRLIEGDYFFMLERPEPFAHGLFTFMTTRGYRPKCIVEYDRFAFIHDINETRITFDSRLRALESPTDFFNPDAFLYPVLDPAQTTMEVKYNGFLFSHIKKIINLADRPRVSNSKYIWSRNFLR